VALYLYFPVFHWTFWKDDWWFLWGSYALHPRLFTNIIQPGTVIQFLVGWNVFHAWPLPYMVFGILCKVYFAYILGLLCGQIVSKRIQLPMTWVGLVFPIGIDAVGWPSAHVTLMAAGLLLSGLYWIYAEKPKTWIGYLLLFLSFAFDPGRTIGVLAVLLWVLYRQKKVRAVVLKILGGASICVAIGIMWKIRTLLSDFQVMKYVLYLEKTRSLSTLGHTWKYIFDYFASIGNLLYGSFWELPNYLATGIYTRTIAVVGFISIVALSAFTLHLYRKYHERIPLAALAWILVGYLIPWLFEPRITLSVYHRYMVIPSIGYFLLIAWGIDRIKIHWVHLLLCVCIVGRGVWISNQFIVSQIPFRDISRSDEFYTVIESIKLTTTSPIIIHVTGTDQFIPAALSFSEEMPLALKLRTKDFSKMPFIAITPEMLKQYECGKKNPFAVFGYTPMVETRFSVVHVQVDTGRPIQIIDTKEMRRASIDCQ
jgi:hypothetical protein